MIAFDSLRPFRAGLFGSVRLFTTSACGCALLVATVAAAQAPATTQPSPANPAAAKASAGKSASAQPPVDKSPAAKPSAEKSADAQTPAEKPPTQPSAAAPAGTPVAGIVPLEPQGYTNNAAGRRDPFVSLVRRGSEVPGSAVGVRPAGVAGMSAGEVLLRGTVKGRQGYVAMLQGADSKTYLVRPGDKLLDGTIRTITADMMVILQKVSDPLSLETTREVRKMLRQTEEAR